MKMVRFEAREILKAVYKQTQRSELLKYCVIYALLQFGRFLFDFVFFVVSG